MPITPGVDTCGASDQSNDLYTELLDGEEFVFPDIDFSGDQFQIPSSVDNPLYSEVPRVTVAELTTRTIGGDGVFDAMMDSTHKHLEKEFTAGRISGREYAEVYMGSIQQAMSQAVQFLMGKDQAYWQSINAQAQARRAEIEAVTARIQLESTKLEYITRKADAKTSAVEFALKKIQLSIADVEYCNKLLEKAALTADVESKVFANANMLPLQKAQLEFQNDQIEANILGMGFDNTIKQLTAEEMMPKQIDMLNSQMLTADVERQVAEFGLANITPKQAELLNEQIQVQRAQTLGNRTDGAPVAGQIGLDNATKQYTLDNLLPAQHEMVKEQVEGARAQTLNTRTDGTTVVVGLIGKQKELYDQQITSYQRDAEVKAAKMFIDTWVTQKTIDEGLTAPTSLQNASIDTVMSRIKVNNNLNT